MASSRIADAVGRVLGGRYRLLAPIGTGASATVYAAEDVTLHRRVAVKLLHAGLAADEAFLRRFRAEARAAASLSHPNVMRVFDWGEDEEGPYLVLELLEGGSLRDLLDGGHLLTREQAARAGAEAADALDHAHRRGLVHRDVKPANLLFDDEGRLRVADFGLARALAEATLTEPVGSVVGTARYVAPEQVAGATADERTDVYALALVLVEAVTGRVPFAGASRIETLMARVDHDMATPRALGALGPVLAAAGRADASARPTAAQLRDELREVSEMLPPPAELPLVGVALGPAASMVPRDPTDHGVDASPVARRRRTRRPQWSTVLIAIGTLVVLVAGTLALVQALVPSQPAPRLIGLQFEDAVAEAKKANLKVVAAEREYRDGTTDGEVLDQRPAPGAMQKENRPIRLLVSRGPNPVEVPDLLGLTHEAADARLKEVGLRVGTVSRRFDDAVPRGQVVDWQARGGTVPRGGTVDITVSDGRTPIEIPDLSGQSLADATNRLRELGFDPVAEAVFSDTVEKDKVVATNPPAGSKAQPGSRVTVQHSRGPAMVEVPDVICESEKDATRKIEAAGLRVGLVERFGPRPDRVAQTDPERGTRVRRGSQVHLLLARICSD